MRTLRHSIAVPPLSRQVPQYLTACRLVVTMMSNNLSFPDPTPPLKQVSADLDALAASEDLVYKGGRGMAQQRDVDLRAVQRDLRLLKAYVQGVAEAHPTEAEAIITSAGMSVGKTRAATKPPVRARQGKVSGRVVLDATALPRPVQYCWQSSTDQKTWTDIPPSFQSRTLVDGLTPATVYFFRLRTMTRSGLSDWSPVLCVIAL